jgi:signal transduction histidine kinase/ligand-binding sensor domain-containing protein
MMDVNFKFLKVALKAENFSCRRMKYGKFYIIFVAIILNSYAFGQKPDIRFHHLTVEDGLSQNWITCILQDSYGFMWFGTGGNGISKYNGYEFNVYKNDLKNKNTLTNNFISVVYEDKNKHLWVGTPYGLNQYDRETDRFVQFPGLQTEYIMGLYEPGNGKLLVISQSNIFEIHANKAIPFCSNSCLSNDAYGWLNRDQFGHFWLATATNGIMQIDIKNKRIIRFKHNEKESNSLSSNRLSCTYTDNKGHIWIGTWDKGISLIKFKNGESPYFQNFLHSPFNPAAIHEGAVRAMLDDAQGNLWVSSENGGLYISDINNLESGNYFFNHYQNNPNDNASLSNNSIHCMYRDKQGTIWVGTYGAGVDYYNKSLFQFEHYKEISGETNGLSNNIINVFFEDGDDLWIGTEDGLNILNRKTGKYKIIRHSLSNKQSISANAIWSIFKDSRGNMWVGTWAGGLNLYNRSSETFTHYYYDIDNPEGISSNNIFGIIEDRGFLYLATMNGGLCRYDYRTNKFKTYKSAPGKKNRLPNNWVQSIYKTKNGEIWVSTSDGIAIFDPVKETFTTFRHNPADIKSMSYPTANETFEDSKHNIWLATDGGLNMFLRKDSTFIYYHEADGLPDNSVKSICEDKRGNLWLGTINGISKFVNAVNRPVKPVFKNYNKHDGLQGNEFCRRASFQGTDGKLYFGGFNGFNAFDPDSIKDNPTIPAIVITDFLLFNKPAEIGGRNSPLNKSIGETKELVLNHDQYVMSFKYAALNYIFPEKNRYKYIMEGFEKEWNNVGSKREATYTNLSPGKYTFRVIGCNNNNIWNEKGTSIKIIILPPWWLTWWCKLIIMLTLASSVYIAYYLRIEMYRQKQKDLTVLVRQRTIEISKANEILLERQTRIEEYADELSNQTENLRESNNLLLDNQKLIESQASQLKNTNQQLNDTNQKLSVLNSTKDRFFSIIAHDLRNPFHTVSGFAEILLKDFRTLPPEKVERYLKLISITSTSGNNLLENLLQWSRSQTGRIDYEPYNLNLSSIAEETINLMEGDFLNKKVTIRQLINEDLVVLGDLNMLKTIFRNLISNALKFSQENGVITLESRFVGQIAEVTISDNGVGIPPENLTKLFRIDNTVTTKGTLNETGTGLGLILCKEFIDKHNGKIWVESEVGKGSKFTFTLLMA